MAWGCDRYEFEDCVRDHGLLTGDNLSDADLLCTLGEPLKVEIISSSAVAITAYLFTNVYIQFAEASTLTSNSNIWGKGQGHRKEAKRAIVQATILNVIAGGIFYIVSVAMVRYLVSPLDNRTNYIVVGASLIFSAIVFLMMSINFTQWTGIYHSRKNTSYSFTSARVIRFTLSWNIWKQLLSMYFFTLYFACADVDHSIPRGILIGIVIGGCSIAGTIMARSKKYSEIKRASVLIVILLFTVLSCVFFYLGIDYIRMVWGRKDNPSNTKSIFFSVAWVAFMIIVHLLMKNWTIRKAKAGAVMRFNSMIFSPGKFQSFANLVIEDAGSNDLDSSAMQPVDCMKQEPTEEPTEEPIEEGRKKEEEIIPEEEGPNDLDSSAEQPGDYMKQEPTEESVEEGKDKDEESAEEKKASVPLSEDVKDPKTGPQDDDGGERKRIRSVTFSNVVDEESRTQSVAISEDTRDHTARPHMTRYHLPISRYVSPENAPPYWELFMNKMVETYPCLCSCLNRKYGDESISTRRLDYVDSAAEISTFDKLCLYVRRILWYFLSAFFLFLTIVNIGATYQQCFARKALGGTFALLYPENYLTGEMCAWDAPGPNSTLETFESPQAAYDAGYEIAHCGACGYCSNWNDLSIQWSSTEVLSGIGTKCAKEGIMKATNTSDPNDAVVKCMAQKIGWTTPCAMSWAWDAMNTKDHSIFVYLQAQFANFASDVEVTFMDITLATIDEAISGPRFVKEVGSTRRRMNIQSDIQRPQSQRCTVVTQNWTEIFPDPFRPPVGGTYTIRPPGKSSQTITVIGQDSDSL